MRWQYTGSLANKDARTYLFFRIKRKVCEWEFCANHVVCILLSAFQGLDTLCDPDGFEGSDRTRPKNAMPFSDLLRTLNVKGSETLVKMESKTYLNENCLFRLDDNFNTWVCNVPQRLQIALDIGVMTASRVRNSTSPVIE